MLTAAASVLKEGGTLVYSVCTVSHEETSGVVQRMLESDRGMALDPILAHEVPSREFIRADGCFSTFPSPGDFALDGFFAARMRRVAR
jgi:16S rRNA (cytosine967-C5)-methyltransferase